ncbi:MAG: sugar phosphate isomerase/epimerase [Bacteroidota bacterium]
MDKRTFLRQSVILAAGAPLLSLACQKQNAPSSSTENSPAISDDPDMPLPYLDTIGLQLYTVRDQMAEDPQLTLEILRDIGYRQVELGDTRTLSKLVPICRDLGLAVHSSFMKWSTITGRWDLEPADTPFEFAEVLDQANEAELSHLVFGYIQPGERENLDAYRLLADQLNEAGLKAKERGLKMTYHNHNFEWHPMEGSHGFNILAERLDPEVFTFELDVFWAAIAGQDPVEVLTSIKDQVSLLHLKDLKAATSPVTVLDDVPEDAYQELGNGTVDIKTLMKMGHDFGVDYCFVEQDQSPDPLASTKTSFDWLHA